MKSYRIRHGRFDVPASTWKEFEAENNEEAKKVLAEEAKKDSLTWETLWLIRIDAPAVPEKTTAVDSVREKNIDDACFEL